MVFTYGQDDGWWMAEAPGLQGAYGQGRTKEAAKKNLESAIVDVLETYRLLGRRPVRT